LAEAWWRLPLIRTASITLVLTGPEGPAAAALVDAEVSPGSDIMRLERAGRAVTFRSPLEAAHPGRYWLCRLDHDEHWVRRTTKCRPIEVEDSPTEQMFALPALLSNP